MIVVDHKVGYRCAFDRQRGALFVFQERSVVTQCVCKKLSIIITAVCIMRETDSAYNIVVGKPEGKISVGRCRCTPGGGGILK